MTARFPIWLRQPFAKEKELFNTSGIVEKYRLNTVCEEAKCPNRMSCYSKKTATFLALGKACTRACGFCDIDFTKVPAAPEEDEPERIALSALELSLSHVVITMVARDDLSDGGADHMAKIINAIRHKAPKLTIEVLTSDFHGNKEAWATLFAAKPDIFNHNVETVRRLSPRIRHRATYDRSLEMLKMAASSKLSRYVKSGIMVGLGEEESEVFTTLDDLFAAGCDIVTIGQYLQASHDRLRVKSYVDPDQFARYEAYGKKIGIKKMYVGPFVRSSYNADAILNDLVH